MKNWVIGVVVLIVIVGGAAALAMHKKNNNSTSTYSTSSQSSNMHNMQSSTSQSSSAANTQATDKVTISNFSFSPASISVKKGTTVTWTNHDSVAHTVVETDGQSGPQSQDLSNGQSYSFTYNTAGTFHYHCSIHPDMTGQVVVTE